MRVFFQTKIGENTPKLPTAILNAIIEENKQYVEDEEDEEDDNMPPMRTFTITAEKGKSTDENNC